MSGCTPMSQDYVQQADESIAAWEKIHRILMYLLKEKGAAFVGSEALILLDAARATLGMPPVHTR